MDKDKTNIRVKFISEDGLLLKEQTFGSTNLISTVKTKATEADKEDHPIEWAAYQAASVSEEPSDAA